MYYGNNTLFPPTLQGIPTFLHTLYYVYFKRFFLPFTVFHESSSTFDPLQPTCYDLGRWGDVCNPFISKHRRLTCTRAYCKSLRVVYPYETMGLIR